MGGYSLEEAELLVAAEFPAECGLCGGAESQPSSMSPQSPPPAPPDKVSSACQSVWEVQAGGFTCGERITWLVDNRGFSVTEAEDVVAAEFPAECGPCGNASSISW